MKIPKIEFVYSSIYDDLISKKPFGYHLKKRKLAENYVKKISSYWKRIGEKILKEMSIISRLNWKREKIVCYISLSSDFSISEPLTLAINKKNIHYIITNLCHELCHILFWDNKERVLWPKDLSKNNLKKYYKESYNTILHLPVHSLLILTFKKIFRKDYKRFLNYEKYWEIWPEEDYSEYKRSWEIVERDGAENILKIFLKLEK